MKSLKLLALAIIMVVSALPALAEYTGPAVSMFYPGQNDDSPMDLKPTAKAYIYFVTGSKVVEAKAAIVQGAQQLGSCTYAGSATGVTTCTMDPAKEANADMANIQAGHFTLNFYEVTYIVDGEQHTYNDPAAPFASVTYNRPGSNGTIVSQTGIADATIKSYYPADGTDGVKTYTFSKAVKPGVVAYLLYGGGDMPNERSLPCTLQDDGMMITIDMRGMCNNVDALAPGVVFTDDQGNPCDPPSTITLVVENLNCVDGTKIATVSTSLDGQHSSNLEGKLYQPYNYVDLTFPTPVITDVRFYDSAAPADEYATINGDTDMMVVRLANSQYIAQASLLITAGSATATVPATIDAGTVRLAIPIAIKASGEPVVVTLTDVTYTVEDGAEHAITPYETEAGTAELLTVADILALDPETECTVNLVGGIKVTYVNAALGYTFAEDVTGGMMVVATDFSQPLTMGMLVKGKLVGTYLGGGMFMIDTDKSNFTETPADIVATPIGSQIEDAYQVYQGKYDNMLITVAIVEPYTASYDANSHAIVVSHDDGLTLRFVTDLVEGFEAPGELDTMTSVTGIVYCDVTTGDRYVLMRDAADCDIERAGIAGVEVDAADSEYYDLRGVRHDGTLRPGIYISNSKKVIIK